MFEFMGGADPLSILRQMLEGQNQTKGKKICDLTNEEEAAMQEIVARLKGYLKEKERLDLNIRSIIVDKDKWWQRVRDKHNLSGSTTYDDAAIFEIEER